MYIQSWTITAIFRTQCILTVDFDEVKTVPTECKEKGFQMMSPAYLHHSKAP